jgi:hypothetical protein
MNGNGLFQKISAREHVTGFASEANRSFADCAPGTRRSARGAIASRRESHEPRDASQRMYFHKH